AAAQGMAAGQVEEMFYPRNPLDVLAQQIVAACAERPWKVDDLYAMVRRAAPFAELPRTSFEGVLDMLSGRYPSDEFAELKARLSWDRVAGTVRAREGAARVAVVNGGPIPDRGLYGVFLRGQAEGKTSRRVGELDEEMVFETRTGEVFVLGASSWRVEEVTHDKVLVSPAPGEPGKMPFWHGDRPGRPLEFGQMVGKLARELAAAKPADAEERLREKHGLDERAARNLLQYLREQVEVTGEVPSDRTVVVERYVDEVGDWRVCVLTPFGARVHAPWATAVVARLKADRDTEIESMYSDDGMVFRLPESDEPPDPDLFFPAPDEIEDLVTRSLGGTSLFAARFRENAARALLLPRRHPGKRSPLSAQLERALQRLDGRHPAKHADAAHDLLLGLGDLTVDELAARSVPDAPVREWLEALRRERRAFPAAVAGEQRWMAAEDAARMRDGLGIPPPQGMPRELLEPVRDALGDLVSRYARTHGPFRPEDVARRLGLGPAPVTLALERLEEQERVLQGEFLPGALVAARYADGARGREWCDAEVLRGLRRRSLAKLRKQVE